MDDLMLRPVPLAVAAACVVAAVVWLRSGRRLRRSWQRIEHMAAAEPDLLDAARLARSAYRKDIHAAVVYACLAVVLVTGALLMGNAASFGLPVLLLTVPIALTLSAGRRFLAEAGELEERSLLQRRAAQMLEQDQMAPAAWARRLAPRQLPATPGFEVGHVYEPGTGVMAGDFYDAYAPHPTRLAVAVGDVSGHGIEPAITAFQVKYLLRVFLRSYRDPAQALEELNRVAYAEGRAEEFVSLCVLVFDTAAGTMRWASAGHPAAWLWHDGEVRALAATGPLLGISPDGAYLSREVRLDPGDVALLYTDGLTEARNGEVLFGEERVASHLSRDPGKDAGVLCKELLDSARDFASAPLADDVAIVVVRRV